MIPIVKKNWPKRKVTKLKKKIALRSSFTVVKFGNYETQKFCDSGIWYLFLIVSIVRVNGFIF